MLKYLLKFNKTGICCFCRYFSGRNVMALKDRGMIQEIFPENAEALVTDVLTGSPQTVYAGFDPTADSLHIGNLLVLVNLLHWQRGGHHTIALVGGATAKVGDPSGRNTERELLSTIFINDNVNGIYHNIQTIFSNHQKYIWDGKHQLLVPEILNNDQWYQQLNAVELIVGVGRYMRMGTLLSRTSVRNRLQSSAGMSFTEFSYQLFQAYDWLHLYEKYRCSFQIGGNDQMGNIMSGQELISKVHKKQVYGLTVPLVTTEMGNKFGKTAGNAVWLSPEKTSSFTFYQFWIRQPDSEVEKFLKLFTFDSLDRISELMKRHAAKPELRLAQTRLAEQVTLLVHGEEGVKRAQQASEALYKGSVTALSHMRPEEIADMFAGAAVVEILPEAGQTVFDLAMKIRCFGTKDDALRIISAGGFYINQQRINNPSEVLNLNVHILGNKVTVVRVGKKNYYIVKWLL